MKYAVKYQVVGFDNTYSTEAYDFYWQAESHKNDIAAFEGVYSTTIYIVNDNNKQVDKHNEK